MIYVYLIAALGIVWIMLGYMRSPKAATMNTAEHQTSSNRNLRWQLVERLRGDEDGASRLIELERKRRPSALENDLVRFALARLDSDRLR